MRQNLTTLSIPQWTPVEVRWLDSVQDTEWETNQYEKIDPVPEITSIGYLFRDLEDQVVILQSYNVEILGGELGQIDTILQIPKCSITQVTPLKQIKMYVPKQKRPPERRVKSRTRSVSVSRSSLKK